MNKITLPEIPQEALTPEMLELLAVLERLADTVHRAQEKIQRLEAEIAKLKKDRKRA